MAGLVRGWRAPLFGGVALWLLSFPLLTAHPAPVMQAAAHLSRPADAQAAARRLVRQVALDEHLARAAAEPPPVVATPAVASAPAAAVTLAQTAPAARPAPVAPVVRANTVVIP